MKNDDVISHLQIIHTWASFAYERGDILRLPEIHKIMEWTDDALELLKEQDKRINELEEKLRLMEYGDQDILQSGMMPAT